jgi:hypothetical protein
MRVVDPSTNPPAASDADHWTGYGIRRGADIGAVISATPLMWVALGEASEFMQFLLVAAGVSAFAAIRTRLPLPPFSRVRK